MTKKQMLIKPFYTVGEIAKLINYSRKGARQFLYRLKIPISYIGNRNIVYLSDLQTYSPVLYSSILEAASLNELAEANRKSEEENEIENDDDYAATKTQFIK